MVGGGGALVGEELPPTGFARKGKSLVTMAVATITNPNWLLPCLPHSFFFLILFFLRCECELFLSRCPIDIFRTDTQLI
jgi:hypothetical protein